jgi:hypothetical protein
MGFVKGTLKTAIGGMFVLGIAVVCIFYGSLLVLAPDNRLQGMCSETEHCEGSAQ